MTSIIILTRYKWRIISNIFDYKDAMRRILTGFILIKVMTLFVALVFCGCKDNVENAGFINKILNDRSRHGMFIEVKNKATQKIYMVENTDCYLYFSDKNGWGHNEYKKNMLDSYLHNGCFLINENRIPDYWVEVHGRYRFYGEKKLVNKFFDKNGAFKKGFSNNEKYEIIQRLFHLEIACRVDCESGIIVICK